MGKAVGWVEPRHSPSKTGVNALMARQNPSMGFRPPSRTFNPSYDFGTTG
jgi:hypothetical protein